MTVKNYLHATEFSKTGTLRGGVISDNGGFT